MRDACVWAYVTVSSSSDSFEACRFLRRRSFFMLPSKNLETENIRIVDFDFRSGQEGFMLPVCFHENGLFAVGISGHNIRRE